MVVHNNTHLIVTIPFEHNNIQDGLIILKLRSGGGAFNFKFRKN